MYVWFDALFSYLTPMLATPERRAFWPANVHLIGKDILRFHAVYWPAFLWAAGMSDDEIPRSIFAHGFLTVNGQKMSKSRGTTINPLALAEAFGTDTLRYYLMRAIAFGQDGDFNIEELIGRYNSDLGNALGNLCNRVLKQTDTVSGGKFPEKGDLEDLERSLFGELATGERAAAEAYEAMQPHRALEAIWQVVGAANQYIDKAAPWAAQKRGDTKRASTILATALETLGAISTMVWPVLPKSADTLRAQIGLSPVKVGDADQWPARDGEGWTFRGVSRQGGETLGVAAPIFPRIDPDREKQLLADFGPLADDESASTSGPAKGAVGLPGSISAGGAGESAATVAAGAPATITYDDFAKLDLRVGVVVRAEKVQGKDKLLSLAVDIGEPEPRAIVAGLALSFKPEELVGTRVIVVANLEPRKFGKGLVSQGMLMAAGPSDALSMATVSEKAAPGTKVK
jgi:methionyl-tRNA synthetase